MKNLLRNLKKECENIKNYYTYNEAIELGCKICKHDAGEDKSCSFRPACIGWCPWFSPKDGINVEKVSFEF